MPLTFLVDFHSICILILYFLQSFIVLYRTKIIFVNDIYLLYNRYIVIFYGVVVDSQIGETIIKYL